MLFIQWKFHFEGFLKKTFLLMPTCTAHIKERQFFLLFKKSCIKLIFSIGFVGTWKYYFITSQPVKKLPQTEAADGVYVNA